MEQYKLSFQLYLGGFAKALRDRNGISQEKMAELLRINVRSYADLEHKRYCFSTPTFIFLLLLLPDEELLRMVGDFHRLVKEIDHETM